MIGQRIKDLRQEKHLTQTELAKRVKVSQAMISWWENNKCEPTASNIIALCDLFNVCADYLLGRQDWY